MRGQKQPEMRAESEPPQRRNRTCAVGLDAAQLGHAAFERAGFSDPTLVLRWSEIVGPEIARFAQPVRLTDGASGGVLTLKADPAASVFLQHESRALCGRINAYVGAPIVHRLRFVAGETASRPGAPRRSVRRDAAPGDPARNFSGRESLREALLALAEVRTGTGAQAND